jgi:hypothetical protein
MSHPSYPTDFARLTSGTARALSRTSLMRGVSAKFSAHLKNTPVISSCALAVERHSLLRPHRPNMSAQRFSLLSARTAAVGVDVDRLTSQAQTGDTESMLILGLAHRDGVGATRHLRLADIGSPEPRRRTTVAPSSCSSSRSRANRRRSPPTADLGARAMPKRRTISPPFTWIKKNSQRAQPDAVRYNLRALLSTASFFERPGAKVLWKGDYLE